MEVSDLPMNSIERYILPNSLEQALEVLSKGQATVLAGGTDLMPQTQAGVRKFQPTLLNIRRLSELRGISESAGRISIGALTTVSDILESDLLKSSVPVLVQAADCFASVQIRNVATLGGNICNGSPAGDMIIPLLLLDAEVKLVSFNGAGKNGVSYRTVPLKDFFEGPGQTRIARNEILASMDFNVPLKQTVGIFRKFGTRPALDISLVSVGVLAEKKNGALQRVRVAFGAVAPTPIRGYKTEVALEGSKLDSKRIREIAAGIKEEISPISDVRGSAWYREEVLTHLTEQVLYDVSHA